MSARVPQRQQRVCVLPALWRAAAVRLLAVALVLSLAGGGYCGYVAVRRRQLVELPRPHGPYAVGRVITDLTDTSRRDPFATRPGEPRELSVWFWYPAAVTTGPRAEYAPGPWEELHLQWPVGLFEGSFSRVRNHAREAVPAADGAFPLVVLAPGLGFSAQQYTVLAEDVASRGYVVAGVTPTYSANVTVLDGRTVRSTRSGDPSDIGGHTGSSAATAERLIRVWADDARFVAATAPHLGAAALLTGHVDPRRVAYVGHSFGGAASLQACAWDPHCAGAVDLDGTQFGPVLADGLRTSFMILGSAGSCVTGSCEVHDRTDRADRDAARALLAASTAHHWCYDITGTRHFNFTDDAALYLAPPVRSFFALGGISGRRGLVLQNALVGAFLDQAVRGRDPLLVARTAEQYSEVHDRAN